MKKSFAFLGAFAIIGVGHQRLDHQRARLDKAAKAGGRPAG
jgi:hypothetical protein